MNNQTLEHLSKNADFENSMRFLNGFVEPIDDKNNKIEITSPDNLIVLEKSS